MKVVSAAREDDFIPLSALQHYLFCPRQCALIHVEQAWAENRFTAEGRVLHEATAEPGREKRRGVRVITAMPVVSRQLGVWESPISSRCIVAIQLAPLPGRIQARQAEDAQRRRGAALRASDGA